MAGYFFNDEYATPDAIDRRRALINALAKDNLSTAPVGHWTAALARVVGAGADQYETAKLNEADKKGSEKWTEQVMSAIRSQLGGGGISPTAEPSAGAGLPASLPAPAAPAPVAQQPLLPNRPQMPEGPNIFERVGGMIPEAMGQEPPKPSPFGSLNQPQASNPTPLWMQQGLTKGVPGVGQMPVNPSLAFSAPGQMAPMGGATQMAGAPNSGQPSERELVIRTIAAETSGKSPQEAQAIAAVILNRAKTRGLSPADVVLERNQFEPWNGGPGGRNDPMNIPPNSPRYQQAAQALAAAIQGQDPTGGATHFFAPRAQAALGRNAPAWAQGPGQQIGATAFYAPEGRAPGGAVPVGDMPAPGAQTAEQAMQRPAPGQFVNPVQGGGQGAQRPSVNAALLQALASPWAAKNPMLAQLGAKIAGDQLTGTQFGFQVVGDQMYRTNPRTGQVEPVGVSAQKPMIIPEGGTLFDPNTKQVLATGGNKDTPDLKNYQEAVKGGFRGSFTDYQIALRRATSAQPESTFNIETAKGLAKEFNDLAGELPTAKTDIANIKALRQQFDRLPGGFLGNAQAAAVRMGVKVGPNASAVEAADAILNRLTPAQRQGLPGAASDRDIQMFRGALPSLGNTKEGQKIITDTMEGLAQYKLAQAQIAQQARTGKIKPEEALAALEALPDPFEQFKKLQDQMPSMASQAIPAQAAPSMPANPNAGWTEIAPGVRIREKK